MAVMEEAARAIPTPAQLANKALHGLVAVGKAEIGNQVLPDGHGIPATTESPVRSARRTVRTHWWPGL